MVAQVAQFLETTAHAVCHVHRLMPDRQAEFLQGDDIRLLVRKPARDLSTEIDHILGLHGLPALGTLLLLLFSAFLGFFAPLLRLLHAQTARLSQHGGLIGKLTLLGTQGIQLLLQFTMPRHPLLCHGGLALALRPKAHAYHLLDDELLLGRRLDAVKNFLAAFLVGHDEACDERDDGGGCNSLRRQPGLERSTPAGRCPYVPIRSSGSEQE